VIYLSNGHELEYVIASGALAYDGKGWPHEWPLRWLGFIKPELFTVVTKTLTLKPRPGNMRWWNPLTWLPFSPWSCVRTIPGGTVNKVGLTNPGFDKWVRKVGRKLRWDDPIKLIVSLYGTQEELVAMVKRLEEEHICVVGIELNPSCPNTGHDFDEISVIVASVKAVKAVTQLPIILKVSVAQNHGKIVQQLEDIIEAVSFNSVPWHIMYPNTKSPLWLLEKKVKGGGGGISGKPAQQENWHAVAYQALEVHAAPVIAPSIMDYHDIDHVYALGARAVHFGAIHLPDHPVWKKPWTIFTNPCKPTRFVLRKLEEKNRRNLLSNV
jgi:dihydroorotate dehydrogenase